MFVQAKNGQDGTTANMESDSQVLEVSLAGNLDLYPQLRLNYFSGNWTKKFGVQDDGTKALC